jgi:DNA-binding CsgD family transcriptional regulator
MTSNELSHQEQVKISQYIAAIYKQSRQMNINDFRYFCLNSLHNIIDFDGALWFDRRENDLAFTGSGTFLYQVPDGFMENYNEFISKTYLNEDPVGLYAANNPNVAFNFSDIFETKKDFYKSKIYIHHCKKFNQNDVLTTLYFSNSNQKIQAVAFYKFNTDRLFSNKDKVIKSILDPHFSEAMSMNILANFDRICSSDDMCRGITDVHGNILEAENTFIRKMEIHNNSNINNIAIPALKNITPVIHNLPDGTEIKLQLKDTLILIELSNQVNLSTLLTPKQLEVCTFLKEGLPDKAIAKELNISAFTVSNHLKNIYQRLGTKNRLGTLSFLSNKS